ERAGGLARARPRVAEGAAVGNAVGLVREAQLLHQGEAGARDVEHGVLLVGRAGDAVLAGAGRIDELDLDAGADAGQVAVEPDFEGVGRRVAAALVGGALVRAARGVRLLLVRRDVHDVD